MNPYDWMQDDGDWEWDEAPRDAYSYSTLYQVWDPKTRAWIWVTEGESSDLEILPGCVNCHMSVQPPGTDLCNECLFALEKDVEIGIAKLEYYLACWAKFTEWDERRAA
jgi:hypothetical protein